MSAYSIGSLRRQKLRDSFTVAITTAYFVARFFIELSSLQLPLPYHNRKRITR